MGLFSRTGNALALCTSESRFEAGVEQVLCNRSSRHIARATHGIAVSVPLHWQLSFTRVVTSTIVLMTLFDMVRLVPYRNVIIHTMSIGFVDCPQTENKAIQ